MSRNSCQVFVFRFEDVSGNRTEEPRKWRLQDKIHYNVSQGTTNCLRHVQSVQSMRSLIGTCVNDVKVACHVSVLNNDRPFAARIT